MPRRLLDWLLRFGVAVTLASGCSLADLEYLRNERDIAVSGSAGSAGKPNSAAGGTAGNPGSGGGGDADPSANGGSSDDPPAGRDGGQGGQITGEGGGASAGDASGGEPTTPPTLVYGIDGQSCENGLECPGGISCCRRLSVPAGTFAMGTNSDANALPDEKPPHSASLSAFELDELEVTVSRFRRFVERYDGTMPAPDAGAHPDIADSGWRTDFASELPATRAALQDQLSCDIGAYQTWTAQAGARETMPINCVSWYVAFAFCIWDGGRLPTEAEWEKASAGGDEERLYPWGATAPDYALHAIANCQGNASAGCSPEDVLPVGSRSAGRGRWGHQDLAGSLWEWTLDHYDATYYQAVGTCSNCANLAALTPRAIRGGNFTSLPKSLRSSGRASKPANVADPYAGFRCARSP